MYVLVGTVVVVVGTVFIVVPDDGTVVDVVVVVVGATAGVIVVVVVVVELFGVGVTAFILRISVPLFPSTPTQNKMPRTRPANPIRPNRDQQQQDGDIIPFF